MRIQSINNTYKSPKFNAQIINSDQLKSELNGIKYFNSKPLDKVNEVYNAVKLIHDDENMDTFEIRQLDGWGRYNIWINGVEKYKRNLPIMEDDETLTDMVKSFAYRHYKNNGIYRDQEKEVEEYYQFEKEVQQELEEEENRTRAVMVDKINELL